MKEANLAEMMKGATDHMDGDPYSTYIPTVGRSSLC